MPETPAIASPLQNDLVLSDRLFDRVFPFSQRLRSHVHWTPVEIAKRACSLLSGGASRRVLDVGAGVGKLCLVGALTTPCAWTGIESDERMVDAARRAAAALGVESRVTFVHGDATAHDWSEFEAIYLFNPFAEILTDSRLDPMMRRDVYVETVARAQSRLVETRPGTRVVTYHGFGGEMPTGLALLERHPAELDELCLWVREG
ncbi:MAG: class I SAM-dependent methyltransferase [Myxococcales bacterium]|nr:class I SAM-dependent methyltransferase [Myxococcales bacterium]